MIRNISICSSDSLDPYMNLAYEEKLTYSVLEDECILYLWQNDNTVVIGKNQNAYKECNVTNLERDGGHLARRLSGGGAVYHDKGNLNFTFCLRKDNYDVDRQLNVILRAVRSFGLPAEKTGRNDIVVEGRKFSGNAFFKNGDYTYHHGCILIAGNTDKMGNYLNVSREKLESKGVSSVKSRVKNLHEWNEKITVESLREAMIRAFKEEYGGEARIIPFSDSYFEGIKEVRDKYASEDWRFGQKISFTDQLNHRFPFGEVNIQLNVNKGLIKEVKAYSDGLNTEFTCEVEKALEGLPYRSSAFYEASEKCSGDLKELLLYFVEII